MNTIWRHSLLHPSIHSSTLLIIPTLLSGYSFHSHSYGYGYVYAKYGQINDNIFWSVEGMTSNSKFYAWFHFISADKIKCNLQLPLQPRYKTNAGRTDWCTHWPGKMDLIVQVCYKTKTIWRILLVSYILVWMSFFCEVF